MNDKSITFTNTCGVSTHEPHKLMEWFDEALTVVVPNDKSRTALKGVLEDAMVHYIETYSELEKKLHES